MKQFILLLSFLLSGCQPISRDSHLIGTLSGIGIFFGFIILFILVFFITVIIPTIKKADHERQAKEENILKKK